MSVIALPNTFSPNTTISSSQVNGNFSTIVNDYNGGITSANLASDSVVTAKIADANVTTAKVADDAMTDAKLVFGKLRSRQGGSATNWNTQGTNTYDYSATNIFMQAGTIASNASPKSVTFPTAFNQTPIVVCTACTAASNNVFVRVANVTTTGFQMQAVNDTGAGVTTENVNWIAIGE